MFKTLLTEIKIAGMYLSDVGAVYSNNGPAILDSFFEPTFEGYIPILDLIKIDTREKITFANGINKNEEITTYNRSLPGRNYSDSVVKRDNIDVTINDILVGPVKLFLNFTNYNITVVNDNEFRKTFVPIWNERLEKFKNKIVILNIHTLNTPSNIYNITGYNNYLKSIRDKYKNNSALNIEEMKKVVDYAIEKWENVKTSIFDKYNSIKVVTITEIDINEFTKLDTKNIYLPNSRLVISLDDVLKAIEHPETTNSILFKNEIYNEIKKNSFTCYIIDNDNVIADRYINIAGIVKKLSKFKDHNLVNGLYITTIDSDNKIHNDVICDLNEIDNNKYVYKSIEEANKGADIKSQYKDTLDTAKIELETNKISKANEQVELKALYDMLIKNQEAQTKMLSSIFDQFKIREENNLTNNKAEYEKNKLYNELEYNRERMKYDLYRYELDRRHYNNKIEYEEDKFVRDSTIETIKTVGSVVGLATAGIMLYNKFYKK